MFKRILKFFIFLVLIFFLTPIVLWTSTYFLSVQRIDKVENKPVGLVLGAGVYGKTPSPVLEDRLLTAYDLYQKGKIKKLILSGDNRQEDYNEPMVMKKYLLAKGVKENDLVLDYAGLRTYDSCYRLKEIFGQNSAIIITQSFHLPRALYLCNRFGVKSVGVSADKRRYLDIEKFYTREFFAIWQALWETNVTKPEPKFLGPKEKVFE
jgi:vancomycin permeability regulator SanA